jgi:DNA-binding NtrC family response regulator
LDGGTRCLFVDERSDFFSVLARKLSSEFALLPGTLEELIDTPTAMNAFEGIDVLTFGLGLPETTDYRARLSQLEKLAANPAGIPVVAFLPSPERSLMIDAVTAGAYDCFVEMSSLSELAIILRRAAQFSRLRLEFRNAKAGLDRPAGFSSIVTVDPNMVPVLQFASKVANSDANVLITGETGTGKEVLAQAIHEASMRADGPFVAVACASLPESLIEAELFGHERGAFTGAASARRGRFEAAERGTIFLDEVGEFTPGMQVKLLRVLQEKKFERLGSNQSRPMEARIISATHRDLAAMMADGAFRADLYYRCNTIQIELPPLRQRLEDVPLLANLFSQRHARQHKRPERRISPAALSALKQYSWPGNVRELEHAIEHAVVLCEGPEIQPEHLPGAVCRTQAPSKPDILSYEIEVRGFKRLMILKALERSGNNKARAARLLHLSRSSLHRLIGELEIDDGGGEIEVRYTRGRASAA